jgi:hypothetical protein
LKWEYFLGKKETGLFWCYKFLTDSIALQQDLDALNIWTINEKYFQPSKRISRKRTYNLNGLELKVVSTVKDLGIIISKDISWNDHISTVVAKANRILGFLKRNHVAVVNSKALSLLYIYIWCARIYALALRSGHLSQL